MIAADMVVTSAGQIAGAVVNGDSIDSRTDATGVVEAGTAMVLPGTVDHMCQEVTTTSGAKCIMSNNALVYIEDPSRGGLAVVSCQRIGINRIAVLNNGVLTWEYATAQPHDVVPVVQLLVPGGAIIAGETASLRLLITAPR